MCNINVNIHYLEINLGLESTNKIGINEYLNKWNVIFLQNFILNHKF